MADLRMLPSALDELREAVAWYSERSDSAARKFASAIDAGFDAIEAHPLRFAALNDRYRFALVEHFPYYIAFNIEGGVVTIVGFRHTSRDDVPFEAS